MATLPSLRTHRIVVLCMRFILLRAPCSWSGPRMRLMINFLATFNRRMSIHLRGPQRRVTEQLLHRSEISARIQQVRGERVPQGVHVQVLAPPRECAEQPLHRELDSPRSDPLASTVYEHRSRAGPIRGE